MRCGPDSRFLMIPPIMSTPAWPFRRCLPRDSPNGGARRMKCRADFHFSSATMELRQLRYFVAVAEEGNISRAGQKLFLTQPALSRQIQALEHEVGHPLLERKAHAIQLTRAGEMLLRE